MGQCNLAIPGPVTEIISLLLIIHKPLNNRSNIYIFKNKTEISKAVKSLFHILLYFGNTYFKIEFTKGRKW